MSAETLAANWRRNDAWICVLASCAWIRAGTSCPADNKIRLSNKNYTNVCGNTCDGFLNSSLTTNYKNIQ